jgi:UDP:flavonoid glycosyltransferase YjiC (YdhE family)
VAPLLQNDRTLQASLAGAQALPARFNRAVVLSARRFNALAHCSKADDMAHIVLSSVGSFGDLHPYIALANGLRSRGHHIAFAVEPLFEERLSAEGFDNAPLASDLRSLDPSIARTTVSGDDPFTSMRALAHDYLGPSLVANIARLREACAGADLLVASAGQVAASAVVDLTGIPWVTVALSPTIPSAVVSPVPTLPALPGASGRLVNRALWTLGGVATARISDGPLNAARAFYGLPPQAPATGRQLLATVNRHRVLTCVLPAPLRLAAARRTDRLSVLGSAGRLARAGGPDALPGRGG